MRTDVLEKKFSEMGARVKLREPGRSSSFSIDILNDEEGPYFDVQAEKRLEMQVLDLKKKDRHLLLMTKDGDIKSKYLCGHDERHWFTCSIPESAGVSTVDSAKEALKPKELRDIEKKEGLRPKNAHKRKRLLKSGKKIQRQGEFMFVPEPGFSPDKGSLSIVLKKEPMRRGDRSKPHYAEYLYRTGGITVHVSGYDQKARSFGYTEKEYKELIQKDETARNTRWQIMKRDPEVFVKGKITHTDHSTLDLGSTWHKVLMNTENRARAFRNVAFLD